MQLSRAEQAEQTEREAWRGMLKNKTYEQLLELAANSENTDRQAVARELLAVHLKDGLEDLAGKGDLQWNNSRVITALNALQDTVQLDESDEEKALLQKVTQVMGVVFDYDEMGRLEQLNAANQTRESIGEQIEN